MRVDKVTPNQTAATKKTNKTKQKKSINNIFFVSIKQLNISIYSLKCMNTYWNYSNYRTASVDIIVVDLGMMLLAIILLYVYFFHLFTLLLAFDYEFNHNSVCTFGIIIINGKQRLNKKRHHQPHTLPLDSLDLRESHSSLCVECYKWIIFWVKYKV